MVQEKMRLRLVYATQLYWNSWSNINLQTRKRELSEHKIFLFFGTKMTEENWEKGLSPTDWTSSGRCIFLIQKNNLWNLSSLQEYCVTHGLCKSMIGFTAEASSARLDLIIPKIKAGITLIDETGKIPPMRNKTEENESELGGKCILEFRIFSVVQVSHSHLWKGLFRIVLPECCLSTLLWVPDQRLVYSSVGSHPAGKDKRFRHNFIRWQQINRRSLDASFLPSGNSHWSNPAVCWTEWVRSPSLECWQREGDNHRSHLTAGENIQPQILQTSHQPINQLGLQRFFQ